MWCETGSTSNDPQGRQGPPPRAPMRSVVGVLAVAGAGLLGALASPVQAATVDLYAAPAALGAGDCSSTADACAVDAAVTNANGASVNDSVRISLARGNYSLNAPSPTALAVTFAGPGLTFEAPNTGSNGGAISNSVGATLAVEDSTFAYNTASGVGGGAIISFGAATVMRSAFLNNDAPINGGAVNVQPGGTLTVGSSTIAGNTSGGLGGGFSNLGTLNVQKSTIDDGAGNPATVGCAAQRVSDGTATCTVTYSRAGTYSATASYSGDGPAYFWVLQPKATKARAAKTKAAKQTKRAAKSKAVAKASAGGGLVVVSTRR